MTVELNAERKTPPDLTSALIDHESCDAEVGPKYQQVICDRKSGHEGDHYDDFLGIYWRKA